MTDDITGFNRDRVSNQKQPRSLPVFFLLCYLYSSTYGRMIRGFSPSAGFWVDHPFYPLQRHARAIRRYRLQDG